MVGDGQRGEFQFMRLVHQPVQPAGAIEQRILGVQMQMNKVRVRHGTKLLHLVGAEQAGAAMGQIKATFRYDKNAADPLAHISVAVTVLLVALMTLPRLIQLV